jgi:pimeloyl-ACP methyl ester carboxylesterase
MDGKVFEAPGLCPACGMVLQPASESKLGFEPTTLPVGAANYELQDRSGRRFRVHYFRAPQTPDDAPILIVLPGAGRNAAQYRNAWLSTAMARKIVVLALEYPQRRFGFADYNMGGVVEPVDLSAIEFERINTRARVARADDASFEVRANTNRERWLFGDFATVFEHVRNAGALTQQRFDVFGHSAGAQLAHRLVLFQPDLPVRRVVAANAGWYTWPDASIALPFGIDTLGVAEAQIARALSAQLVVLLGEQDNSDAAGGTLLKTPLLDRLQGEHRLERGQRFFERARSVAQAGDLEFAWTLQVAPGVGHDFVQMSKVAGELLYP